MSSRVKRCIQRFSTGGTSFTKTESDDVITTRITQCDEQWRQAAVQMLEILRENEIITRDDRSELKQLLNQCQPSSGLTSYVDSRGYDVVQRSVLRNRVPLIEHMFARGFKIHNRPCSSPLHLACQLGHVHIVRLLLDNGADVTFKSTACYPKYHYAPSSSRLASSAVCSPMCVRQCTPLQIALEHDRVHVTRLLLTHNASRSRVDTSRALFYACNKGADACLSLLVRRFPERSIERDDRGQSLLCAAFLCSERCGRALLDSGVAKWPVDVFLNCSSRQETLLHIVYRSPCCDRVCDVTRLAFDAGFPAERLDARDRYGNTPLLVLIRQVGRQVCVVGALPLSGNRRDRELHEKEQVEHDEQLFECLQLLVDAGADPRATNDVGEGALHLVLADVVNRRAHGVRAGYFNSVLPQINRVLEYLLRHDDDVNRATAHGATPLTWAAHLLASFDAFDIELSWPALWYCFRLLCRSGADANLTDEKGIHVVTLTLTAANRWLTQCAGDGARACRILRRVHELFELFFEHGSVPPDDIVDLSMKQVAILYNVATSGNEFLSHVRGLLMPFVTHGVDPSNMRVVTESAFGGGTDGDSDDPDPDRQVPCKLNAQFYLARAAIVQRQRENGDEGGMHDVLSLFEHGVAQCRLNTFTASLCRILASNFDHDPETTRCIAELRHRRRQPRSLRVLARLTICSCLQWRLAELVPRLPLPPLLLAYVRELS